MNLIPGTRELIPGRPGSSQDGRIARQSETQSHGRRVLRRRAGQGCVRTPRDSYDALETAVNQFLLEEMASRSVLPVSGTLRELRDLLARLLWVCAALTRRNP
jgi:hypothetical protein